MRSVSSGLPKYCSHQTKRLSYEPPNSGLQLTMPDAGIELRRRGVRATIASEASARAARANYGWRAAISTAEPSAVIFRRNKNAGLHRCTARWCGGDLEQTTRDGH